MLLVALLPAGLLDELHWIGGLLHAALAVWLYFLVLHYPFRVVLASLAGEPDPPEWVRLSKDDETLGESLRTGFLLLGHFLPALVLYAAVGWSIAFLVPAVLGWALFPASLLLLASSGALRYAGPVRAWRTARHDLRRYAVCTVPGLVWLLLRFLVWGEWWAGFLDALGLLALVFTACLAGLLARECAEVSGELLRIGAVTKDLEESAEDGGEE